MANAKPVVPAKRPTAAKTIKPVPVSEELSLEEQVAALKAQLAEATEANASLVGGNNAGHRSVPQTTTELEDGTVRVDF